jgi:transcriptional regulator with XRE-family HTH domain
MTQKWHNLGRRREAAITALVEGGTLEQVARKVKVSLRTINNWLREPAFQDAYSKARTAVFERSLDRLLASRLEAVETLCRNMKCGDFAVESRSAVALLERGEKNTETVEILARLESIEAKLAAKPATPMPTRLVS